MKMFTISFLLLSILLPLSAGGQKDRDSTGMTESSMMEKDSMEDSHRASEGSMMMAASPVMDFHGMDDAMMLAEEKPTVLFFFADWCPTCQAAMKEIETQPEKLAGINLLIVDYDNSSDLQMKYGVTYQHTFVRINPAGEALAKWNGGGIDTILSNTELEEM